MTQEELNLLQEMVSRALNDADSFNKIWIAGAAIILSALTAVAGFIVQIVIIRKQISSQKIIAEQQSAAALQASESQLYMQELSSRRIAAANITDKRQVWINELRDDIAKYLSIWQEISWRWDAIIAKCSRTTITDERLEEFKKPIAEMRMQAHEVEIRICLRLNPTEEKHKSLMELMIKLQKTTMLFKRNISRRSADSIQEQFISELELATQKTQEILKEEWDKLKREAYTDPYIELLTMTPRI
ncbi:hypothetical protein ACV6ZV_20670, partial [Pseudomonas aeruginosa]|uniref:hypothetical protein n=1 Tax=Pseudomonas aeruginosa TaxID=287 RepID=UPI00057A9F69|nr:hypothetical protein [Pseudomonas aeruginosa]MBG3957340.1 hypothetical protein [Pseudomonas aeruginosa]MBG4565105.1 hypothetical protein [Pseudomonas aeruginosa]MBG5405951.1 hypothetical protein [Pseudomonas aeruginosa]MBI8208444.1 hypothetical protein [Pseudomonas aeruginosa]MBV6124136.1 hypothetical protein [Pseudomonas aeruginosa]